MDRLVAMLVSPLLMRQGNCLHVLQGPMGISAVAGDYSVTDTAKKPCRTEEAPGLQVESCKPGESYKRLTKMLSGMGPCTAADHLALSACSACQQRVVPRGSQPWQPPELSLSRHGTGGKCKEEASLDSLPEDLLHLVFQAAELHTAAGADGATLGLVRNIHLAYSCAVGICRCQTALT